MHSLAGLQHNQFQENIQLTSKKVSLGQKGFTLIELMITVAVIAILASIAIPNYSDYVRRGRAVEATSILANLKNRMEQYYQDNKTYADVGALIAPCSPAPSEAKYFTFACTGVQDDAVFTITATPVAGQGMDNFSFTIDQSNVKTSIFDGTTGATCWLTRKGGSC
jgi:type IV pilus assembly protein PilE